MAAVASSAAVADKLRGAGLSEAAVTAFLSNYDKLLEGESGLIPEADISAATSLPRLEDLASEAATPDLLAKTVVIKLNGGLGTSMGLERAKSLLVVKDGKSFLDLIAEQVAHAAGVDFVLMNSFSTDADTRAALAKSHPALLEGARGDDLVLLQNKSPKIDAATMAPVSWPEAPDLEWCPPGHGDIYASLLGSGMLDRLLDAGKRYAFVSNSDNLGAVLSPALIAHFASSGAAFMMEVAERTEVSLPPSPFPQNLFHILFPSPQKSCATRISYARMPDQLYPSFQPTHAMRRRTRRAGTSPSARVTVA